MSLWNLPCVDDEPEVVLTRWSLVRTDRDEIHAIGYNARHREGRVSSALVEFDPSARIAATQSGRTYVLAGDPGVDEDALYVFRHWCAINDVETYDDATTEVLRDGLPASSEQGP